MVTVLPQRLTGNEGGFAFIYTPSGTWVHITTTEYPDTWLKNSRWRHTCFSWKLHPRSQPGKCSPFLQGLLRGTRPCHCHGVISMVAEGGWARRWPQPRPQAGHTPQLGGGAGRCGVEAAGTELTRTWVPVPAPPLINCGALGVLLDL